MWNTLWLCLSLLLSPGHVQRVIDGDTFVLYNVGVTAEEHVRILQVNTYELRDTLHRAQAFAAKDSTAAWLSRGPFTINSCHRDSFGRLLAYVTRGTDTLAVRLVGWGFGTRVR